ncbi:hypothetical protein GJAV_G00235170 [Gymnothorax javanicus]|nr:hypothetical protein GJAV_G00235170 [Gymnothorax javanicus]
MRKFIFPSERLRAQTRMLPTWIAVWLLLQGLCQVSGDPVAQETATAEKAPEGPAAGGMSEEQKAFLKWYYRTEDPSSWKYAMLGLSFVALLLGSVLLVIGTMANRSRRKLAQYKAVARTVQSDELQGLAAGAPQAKTPPQEDTSADTPDLPRQPNTTCWPAQWQDPKRHPDHTRL